MYGDKLRKLREHYGYSQRELAEKLDIPSTTISSWERTDYPSLEGIIKISKFFNTNLWEFFLDDFGQIKHILPNFIEPDDAAMLKLLNAKMDVVTRIEVKKIFLAVLKMALAKDEENLRHLPEYTALFGE